MNKEEIQERIRYSSISYAREHGIISKEEANFILDEYVKEYRDAHPRAENEPVNLKSNLSPMHRVRWGMPTSFETNAARSKKLLAESNEIIREIQNVIIQPRL